MKCKKDAKKLARGRGSLITFLSKSTVTKLTNIIKDLIQKVISDQVKGAKLFSIEMDTT